MTFPEEISKYLPKYLSPDAEKALFDELKNFPRNMDSRIFTSYLRDSDIIFQGDGLTNVLFVDLPSQHCKSGNGIVLSATCDINPENERFIPHNVIYAPIINLNLYCSLLLKAGVKTEKVESHLVSLKAQRIPNIFYLPKIEGVLDESIVFLDRASNCKMDFFYSKKLKDIRLFTLSDYGHYLFVFKLSIHFTRITEGIERRQN